jgi:hypothetical protein
MCQRRSPGSLAHRGPRGAAPTQPTLNMGRAIPTKTVAECLRYRYHVGLDRALDALRDQPGQPRSGIIALVAAAKAARVYPLMRPDLEALA